MPGGEQPDRKPHGSRDLGLLTLDTDPSTADDAPIAGRITFPPSAVRSDRRGEAFGRQCLSRRTNAARRPTRKFKVGAFVRLQQVVDVQLPVADGQRRWWRLPGRCGARRPYSQLGRLGERVAVAERERLLDTRTLFVESRRIRCLAASLSGTASQLAVM